MAKKMLDTRIKNRVINWKRVHLYAEEMKAGRWRLNGEPIKCLNYAPEVEGQIRFILKPNLQYPYYPQTIKLNI